MNKDKILLRAERLSAGYGTQEAVADVSFDVREGEILCIVGESGCGKSTLIKALLGAYPGVQIAGGRVLLEDVDPAGLSPARRRLYCSRRAGIVFQNPGAAFNPIRSYGKQFRETLLSHGMYRKNSFMQDVQAAFDKFSLGDAQRILGSCPYEMSGGMNQRIALALALLLEQKLLLADEPTSALDSTAQLQVARELIQLRDEHRIAQIIVTHNLALAGFLADSIGVMYAGRLVEYGPAQEVLKNPLHPYTRCLIDSVPALDGAMPSGLDGMPPSRGPSDRGCEFMERCPCACAECSAHCYAMTAAGDGHFVSCLMQARSSV